ncbi:hypothetical protein SDC9_96324 [bioreactor metagenome]|uniref:HTH arsR-type domain-containing protein n=1 Tax=bioreactor metagenome TaxID=1076179 RepID=A0A645AIW1_9ZZZZ|nr:winged helix-turn-helix domain-containing protein [Oscillospiraceae bacterium]
MEYNNITGIIYDCIFLGVIYFNKDTVKSVLSKYCDDSDDIFEYYNIIEEKQIFPPKHLYPFFYYDGEFPSVLSDYFRCNGYYDQYTFEYFISLIEKKDEFKKFTVNLLLRDLPQEMKNNILNMSKKMLYDEVLKKLSYTDEIIMNVLNMLNDFDSFIDDIIDYFYKIKPVICDLHQQFKKKIEEEFAIFQTDECINNLGRFLNIEISALKSSDFSFCLIHKYVCLSKTNKNNKNLGFITGISLKKAIDCFFIYNNITLETFINALGNSIRYNVVIQLNKHGALTSSQLSRILNVSNTAMRRHIDILFNEYVIKISNQTNREIYFSINESYFKYILPKFKDFIKTLSKDDDYYDAITKKVKES